MHSVYKYHITKRLGDHSPPEENNVQKEMKTLQLKESFFRVKHSETLLFNLIKPCTTV